MALTEFGEQLADLTKRFLRRELERDAFLKQEREQVRAAILELLEVPRLRSYVWFLLHCRKQAQHNSVAKDVLEELYRYLILDGGQQGRAGKDERFEEHLRERCLLFESRDALPWSCGIRVRNDRDECWYAPVLLEGIPITTASDFAGRVFITSPRLLRNVLLEIWRGDASVKSTTDGRLKRCGSFLAELREEVPANTFVCIKMELDESGCGGHCEAATNKIYAPMKIRLFEVRKKVCLWEGHWHLKFGATTGRASGSSGQSAPWVGLEALMNQALRWLEEWEGGSDEEEAVVTWLYRAEQVMRKQDELWLRHVLDALLVELRKQPERSTLRLGQALDDIVGHRQHRPESQADSSHREILLMILSDYETWRGKRHVDEAESVRKSDVVFSLLRAVMADEDNADDAAAEFAHVVKTMLSGDAAAQAGLVGFFGIARATQEVLLRVKLLRDTFEKFVVTEPERLPVAARARKLAPAARGVPFAVRADVMAWIRSATYNLERGQPERALTELFELMRRRPVTAASALVSGFFLSIEPHEGHRLSSQQQLDNLAREKDDSVISGAIQEVYRTLHQIYLSRLQAGYATDEEKTFLLMLFGVLRPNSEQVVVQLLAADPVADLLISGMTDPDQPIIPDGMIESGIERHLVRHDWVEGKSREIENLLSEQNDLSTSTERRPDQQHREPDGAILSLVPGERDSREPETRQ